MLHYTSSTLRDALEEIRRDYGRLSPSVVVEAATKRGDPYGIHSRFEWDDSEAAHRYRLDQAREMIRRCRIRYVDATERTGPRTTRAYHSLPSALGRSYEPAEEVAQDPMSHAILMREMERDWKTLKRRFGQYREFAEMVRADLDDDAA